LSPSRKIRPKSIELANEEEEAGGGSGPSRLIIK